MRRISLVILGTEILALQIGAEPVVTSADPRYDPASTTACSTETSYSVPVGFHVDTNPSVRPCERA